MVENAGRALALQARELLESLATKHVMVLVGKENNGAGEIVSARRMHKWCANVTVILSDRLLRPEATEQLSFLQKMRVRMTKIYSVAPRPPHR